MVNCVVLMSGGQDSTTVLGYAVNKYINVLAVVFNYNQRHSIEISAAKRICSQLGISLEEVDLSFLSSVGNSSLTGNGESVFVCNRNAIFLTVAHGIAQNVGASVVVGGMCQGDFSGFTDCREVFIKSLENSLNIGYDCDVVFDMPLIHKSKKETFKLAEDLKILDIVLYDTVTCYNGDSSTKHDWGYGCNNCQSCKARREGWESFANNANIVQFRS